MMKNKDSGICQMRCETNFIARQHDSWNCSLGVTFAIMRFAKAFNSELVDKNWIAVTSKEKMPQAVIPSYLFSSINYSLTDKQHLNHIRNEIYNFTDALSIVLANEYKTTKMEYIYEA